MQEKKQQLEQGMEQQTGSKFGKEYVKAKYYHTACSSLFDIRVVSSAYLRLLIFLLATLIPACDSSSPAFHVVCSAYKLGSSVHSILQARVLKWVVIPFSRRSSHLGIKPGSPTLKADSLLLEP